MPPINPPARLGASIAAALALAAAALIAATPAVALTPSTFLACGYAGTPGATTLSGTGCTSLATAVTAAEALSTESTVTAQIDLLPGLYCPIDLPAGQDSLTFQGVGYAGVDQTAGPAAYDGPEAGLTSFVYDSGHCGSMPSAMVQASDGYAAQAQLRFINLTVDGTSGPGDDLDFASGDINLRDAIVENASGAGVHYGGGDETMSVDNSAIINDGNGLDISGFVAVSESTIADNTTGIAATGSALSLANDTLTANATGLTLSGTANTTQVTNTIVGDNTVADCSGDVASGGDWEYYFGLGGSASGSSNNLTGSSCVPNVADPSDITLTSSISSTLSNVGPTPWITPPAQADGAGLPGACEPTGSDQREDAFDRSTSCDIGSVQHDAPTDGVPHPSGSTLDFGSVAIGATATKTLTISNTGSGLLGIAGVAASPAANFSIPASTNGCAYAVLTRENGGTTCTLTVKVGPTATGSTHGTLIVRTTVSSIDVALAVSSGASALTTPHATTVPYGKHVTLTTTLTNASTHAAIGGAKLTLLSRTRKTGGFTRGRSTTTNPKGVASLAVKPLVNTQYEWSYAGSSTHAGVIAKPRTVDVAQKVATSLSAKSVKHGQSVKVSGTVAPHETGKAVTLQRLESGHWVATGVRATIKKVRLPHHQRKVLGFVLTYHPKKAGHAKLRAVRAKTATNATGVSKTFSLTVT